MSDYTKFYKPYLDKGGKIYQKNNPKRLTNEFKKFNIKLIQKGKVKKMYRESGKDKYAYNPITKKAVLLKRNPDGTYSYKNKDLVLRNRNNLIYEPNEEIYEMEANGDFGDLKNAIRELGIQGEYRLIIIDNGQIIFDKEIDFFHKWYKGIQRLNFFVGKVSGIENLIWKAGDKLKFVFTKYKDLKPRFVRQLYAQGVKNCFINPIKLDLEKRYENSNSKSTKSDLEKSINALDELNEYYPDGIPLEDITSLSEKLKISVEIYSPFCKKPYYEYHHKNSKYNYKFINTRLDHIELNDTLSLDNIFHSKNPIKLNQEDLNNKFDSLHKDTQIFIYDRNKWGITQILTETETFILDTEFTDLYNNFLDETKLKYDKTDCLEHTDLQAFIDYGTHYLLTYDFIDTESLNDYSDIEHIDRKKAYFTYHKNEYYNGLMIKITDFRKVDNIDRNGLYYITDLDLSEAPAQFKRLNKKIIFIQNHNIYTSHYLRYMKDLGIKFKIKYGCYGIEEDLKFTNEFLRKENHISHYAKATGIFSNTNTHTTRYANISKEHASLIKNEIDNIYYDDYNKNAIFRMEKQQVKNLKHITAQIIGFLMIDMIQQLLKMNYKKLIRLCVDGMYYYKHDYDNREEIINDKNIKWSKKDKLTFENRTDEDNTYVMNIIDKRKATVFLPKSKERKFYKTELHSGAGGTGKTYSNLNDKGLVDLIYVAPSYKLCSAVEKEYGVKTIPHYYLLNEPYAKKEGYLYKYGNYIIDECSMLNNEQKEYLINNVRGKIIFLGDIQYQLPPIKGLDMNKENIDNVIQYKKVFRFKDDELKTLAKKCRWAIKNNINLNINKLGIQTITTSELKNKYKKEDMILCSENIHNNFYNEMFKDIKKYKVKINKDNYNNGDIIFTDENIKKEFRHSYTTHSVQGENYKSNNIFIDTLHFKSLRMFYTAISRASNFNQLFIIKHTEEEINQIDKMRCINLK